MLTSCVWIVWFSEAFGVESRKRFLWPFLWEPWFCGRNFGSKSVAASCGGAVLRGEISQSSAQYFSSLNLVAQS